MAETGTGRNSTVIVIGAGLSGVSAAKHLEEHGVDTIVLEASDRIGGRLHTVTNSQVGWVDIGGAYVGPTQDRVLKLIRELRLNTYKVYENGPLVHYRKGHQTLFNGIMQPPMRGPVAFLELNSALRELDQMASQVPVDRPWDAPNAALWDKMSFGEWCRRNVWTKNARACTYQLPRVNICTEPNEISLLFTLWYLASAGGLSRINSTEGGAQERKVDGGTQQIPVKLAQTLKGGVHLNEAVCEIEYEGPQCTVWTQAGHKYTARYVVLALPPMMSNKISFNPALPSARTQLCQRSPMGNVIKTMMYYSEPYWRQKGQSGTCIVEDRDMDMPVDATMDDCKPDGSKPCIMGFILGDKARTYGQMSVTDRRDKIAASYAKLFGIQEMQHPVHYEEKDWNSDPWCGGGYTGVMPPGVLSSVGKYLREPIGGKIFLAGTETGTKWAGYMDGAVQAGRRAAREILCELKKIDKSQIWKDDTVQELAVPDLDSPSWLDHAPSARGLLRGLLLVGGASLVLAVAAKRGKHVLYEDVMKLMAMPAGRI